MCRCGLCVVFFLDEEKVGEKKKWIRTRVVGDEVRPLLYEKTSYLRLSEIESYCAYSFSFFFSIWVYLFFISMSSLFLIKKARTKEKKKKKPPTRSSYAKKCGEKRIEKKFNRIETKRATPFYSSRVSPVKNNWFYTQKCL